MDPSRVRRGGSTPRFLARISIAVAQVLFDNEHMRLKVMADYGCWPVWDEDGSPYNVDPALLPIAEVLCTRLLAWAEWFDRFLNWDDPGGSRTVSAAEELAFNSEGRTLAENLQRELGTEATVRYWLDPD